MITNSKGTRKKIGCQVLFNLHMVGVAKREVGEKMIVCGNQLGGGIVK